MAGPMAFSVETLEAWLMPTTFSVPTTRDKDEFCNPLNPRRHASGYATVYFPEGAIDSALAFESGWIRTPAVDRRTTKVTESEVDDG